MVCRSSFRRVQILPNLMPVVGSNKGHKPEGGKALCHEAEASNASSCGVQLSRTVLGALSKLLPAAYVTNR